MTRTAVVAGAGIGGLAVATALAQRGWQVQVHERAPELRMFGAGIWMWENGLLSLRCLGAEEETVRRARAIKRWTVLDDRGDEVFTREFTPDDHMVLPLRADLYQALVTAADRAGVQVVTSSTAVEAAPSGEVLNGAAQGGAGQGGAGQGGAAQGGAAQVGSLDSGAVRDGAA